MEYYLRVLKRVVLNWLLSFHPNTIVENKNKGYARIKYVKDGEVLEMFVKLSENSLLNPMGDIYMEKIQDEWYPVNIQPNIVQGVDPGSYITRMDVFEQ